MCCRLASLITRLIHETRPAGQRKRCSKSLPAILSNLNAGPHPHDIFAYGRSAFEITPSSNAKKAPKGAFF
ncbi:hypothetical protein CEQ31_001560 [Serratia odorifera]|nr:hypothetical protein CEQ31_001560 [Serratia odorifera]RII69734.1 hypothetical protein DX901_24700 [Serratia odorifera]